MLRGNGPPAVPEKPPAKEPPAATEYRLFFERNLAGVYRFTLDDRLLDCNEAFLEILGFESREELLSRGTRSLYADPKERSRLVDRILAEGFVRNHELRLLRKDGRETWVLANIGFVSSLAAETGVLEGTLVDISERKRAEEALLESEARYRRIVEMATEGIWSVDADLRTTFVNAALARMLGYAPEEMLETPARQFTFPEDLDQFRKHMDARLTID